MSDRRVSPVGVVALVVVVGAGLWLGGRSPGAMGADRGAAREAVLANGADAGVVSFSVRTLEGQVMPLKAVSEPTVVMVSSETCGFCKTALREAGRVADGRPLKGLRLVTIEGADVGAPMARIAGVTGALLAGPTDPSAAAFFAFQVRGTPTFVALDETGAVTRTMVGYPGDEAFRAWIGVMLGEREKP